MYILNQLVDISITIRGFKPFATKSMLDKSTSSDDEDICWSDEERYLKMIMKLNPNEPRVFERNTNNILFISYKLYDSLSSRNGFVRLGPNGLIQLWFVFKIWITLATKTKRCRRSNQSKLWIYRIFPKSNGGWSMSFKEKNVILSNKVFWRNPWLLQPIFEAYQSLDSDRWKTKSWVHGTKMGAVQNINFISTCR